MVTVVVRSSEDPRVFGPFEFQSLPQKGDQVVFPWEDDPGGVLIFVVEEIEHRARGAVSPIDGLQEPHCVISGYEIT